MNLKMAMMNNIVFGLPSVIYAVVMLIRRMELSEIRRRLGFTAGNLRSYSWALALAVPFCALSVWLSSRTSDFQGSMIAPFVGAPFNLGTLAGIFTYGVLSTGFPEELLFRGLIAGALFRRLSFWKANFLQAAIFTLPHLLIIFMAPQLWFLAIVAPVVLGLILGWLRHRSGSIWPSVILHAVPNMAGAFAVISWK